MTPEAHKYAAAGSFCFGTTETGEQHDIYNLTTFPGVQRSLCLEDVTDDSSSKRVELSTGVDNQTKDMLERCVATFRKAAQAKVKRKSLEWKSWIDNEVFDLVDMRKFKTEEFCDRTVGTHHQDRQTRQHPQGEGWMGTARFPR